MCLCWGQDNHVKECNYLVGKTIILESNVDVLNTGSQKLNYFVYVDIIFLDTVLI